MCKDATDALRHYRYLQEMRERLPYEIDGTVIKVNSIDYQMTLGLKTRSPRWAVAFKFEPIRATTKILRIDVGVGRTGTLTPVAIMEPVNVGGVKVSRATLHNQDEIDRKDIREGDTVVIQRAGDVIPEVVEVIKEQRPQGTPPYTIPDTCPVCNSRAVRLEGQAAKRCVNVSCPARLKETIRHFASRNAMDIEGLGAKLVEQLVDRELVTNPADLYFLDKETLISLEGMAEKSASNILEALDRSRTVSVDRFLYSMGIPLVGEHVARLLVTEFGDLESLSKKTVSGGCSKCTESGRKSPKVSRHSSGSPEIWRWLAVSLRQGLTLSRWREFPDDQKPLSPARRWYSPGLSHSLERMPRWQLKEPGAR